MSFYRTYRPQIIDEIDNNDVKEKIRALLGKDRSDLPHAYLFTGPKGTGKTTAARIIAKLFNCEKLSPDNGPCGKCDQCLSISRGTNIDVIEIDAASNRGIDEIRALRDRIGLTPANAGYTVYIIDEVHMLTNEAFNALLKTLEEPPPHAIFILATTDLQKIPATIKSRCVHFSFHRAEKPEIESALKRIIKKEKINISSEAQDLLVEVADGSFRDAVKILEQVSLTGDDITVQIVMKALSVSDLKHTNSFIDYIFQGKTKDAVGLVENLVRDGTDIKSFHLQVISGMEKKLVEVAKSESDPQNLYKYRRILSILVKAYGDIRWSPIVQLPLELAIIELAGTDNINSWFKGGGTENSKTPKPVNADTSKKDDMPNSSASAADNSEKDPSSGLISLDKLNECWKDIIEELKPYNHSVAGVMRSARPKSVTDGIVEIEAFYKFHLEKLSEPKTKEILSATFKKLFGEKVKVNIVLGKK